MVPFCRNNALFSKEAKVRKASPKVSPRPEGADCGRKKNQSPLFVKKENMGTCGLGKGVQSLLDRDDGGEKRPGKGAREKDHTEAFYLTFRNSKIASGIFEGEDFFDSDQKTHIEPACRFSRL